MLTAERVSPKLWPAEFAAVMRRLVRGELPWPLYLWSHHTGTGKTTAGLVLLDLANAYGRAGDIFGDVEVGDLMNGFVEYSKLPRILKRVEKGRVEWRAGDQCGYVSRGAVVKRLQTLPLVVIDDVCEVPRIGRPFGEDPEAELRGLLDCRGRQPTIITANLSPWEDGAKAPELVRALDGGAASDRNADRITCGTVFEMPGDSRRRIAKKS